MLILTMFLWGKAAISEVLNYFGKEFPVIMAWHHKGNGPLWLYRPCIKNFLAACIGFLGIWKGSHMLHSCMMLSNTYKENISLFMFPRNCWTRQVRKVCGLEHTHSDLVSHFTEDCFEETTLMAAKFRIKMRRMLRPNAVLTIFEEVAQEQPCLLQRR